ncbi:MAG: type II toxin-antitoxin system VapC family toxin [Oscillospiraceae bacterium]|jgi:tRNA(fMet)-specific endonuclease VapC|nr:type II toxin-antitoxin system VapC family toxin [Oscillospiraceae bacterium]
MKYMLDTNTCIFMLKHVPHVLSVFESKKNDDVTISSIVLAELEFGVYNSQSYEKNRNALIAFLSVVAVHSFDGTSAAEYGRINTVLRGRGTPIGIMDMLIAAHAKSMRATLVTNNTREFSRVDGLALEDWTTQS